MSDRVRCSRWRKRGCLEYPDDCTWSRSRCRKRRSGDAPYVVKAVKTVNYQGFEVTPSVRTYLNKMVFQKPAGPIKQNIEENGYRMRPYNSDYQLKQHIVEEILELAIHDARDSTPRHLKPRDGKYVVKLKNVKVVLHHDIPLREMLGLPVQK